MYHVLVLVIVCIAGCIRLTGCVLFSTRWLESQWEQAREKMESHENEDEEESDNGRTE